MNRSLRSSTSWIALALLLAACEREPVAEETPTRNDPDASAFTFRQNPGVRREIELDRIVKGILRAGDPRDGIPAIRRPHSVPAAEVKFLGEDEPVVAVVVGGEARAYAIRLLDRHEVVNDVLGGVPVAVTYCPLCDSAVAWRRDLDVDPKREGETLTFGISGYLHDSDVLLYDSETETFWQQILGRGVVGPLTGRVLEQIPVVRTTWKAWRERHPTTSAQSFVTEHGFRARDYGPAYAEYRATTGLMFPVHRRSRRLPNRAIVHGLVAGGKALAVPASVLEGRSEPLEVDVGGVRHRLVPDPGLGDPRAEVLVADGPGNAPRAEPAIALRCYWFAWYAFHPDTDVHEPPAPPR